MAHKSLSQLDAFEFSPHEVTAVPSQTITSNSESERAANQGHSASTASPADLALELVMNEMLQQARLASSATGAAIGLLHGSHIVCRAVAGATATEVAAYLAMDCKIVDACLRSGNAQRCDDTETDHRFDAAACKRLGLRSVVVVPVKNKDEKAVGVVEIFSSRPMAFADRDVLMVEGIGHRVFHNMEIARQVMPANSVAPAVAIPEAPSRRRRIEEIPRQIHVPDSLRFWTRPLWGLPKPGFDSKLFLLLAAIALSLTLGWMLGRVHGGPAKRRVAPRIAASTQAAQASAPASEQSGQAVTSATTPTSASQMTGSVQSPVESKIAATADDEPLPGVTIARHVVMTRKAAQPSTSAQTASSSANDSDGSLVVFEDATKEPATPPARSDSQAARETGKSTVTRNSAAIVRVSPAEAEKNLTKRVEPDYPEEARAQNLSGKVVLDIIVDKKGEVHGISRISGDPQLALASARAVQQWQFTPMTRDGNTVQFETRVTLNFSLK